MTAEQTDTEELAGWEELFVQEVDELPVQFVKPAGTDGPAWADYQDGTYLGTVRAVSGDGGAGTVWRVQATHEAHRCLDDTVRALRRPASWAGEREQAARWAAGLLADDAVLAVDVETTGLENAYAVQIAAVGRTGEVVFNEYLHPGAVIEPAAVAVHGITPERVAQAAAFGQLLPRLETALHGRQTTLPSTGTCSPGNCAVISVTRVQPGPGSAGCAGTTP